MAAVILLAVDPGPHTGMAFRLEDGSVDVQMIQGIEEVMALVLERKPAEIAVERFATGGRMSGYGHETVEMVGVMRGLAFALGARFAKRTPQQRYAFMDDARAILNTNNSKIESHRVDALAHLLSWEYWRVRA